MSKIVQISRVLSWFGVCEAVKPPDETLQKAAREAVKRISPEQALKLIATRSLGNDRTKKAKSRIV